MGRIGRIGRVVKSIHRRIHNRYVEIITINIADVPPPIIGIGSIRKNFRLQAGQPRVVGTGIVPIFIGSILIEEIVIRTEKVFDEDRVDPFDDGVGAGVQRLAELRAGHDGPSLLAGQDKDDPDDEQQHGYDYRHDQRTAPPAALSCFHIRLHLTFLFYHREHRGSQS